MRSNFLALALILAIVVAVGLLVELMAVKEGVIPSCPCNTSSRRVHNVCPSGGQKDEFYFMEVHENAPVDRLLAIHKKVYLDDESAKSIKSDDIWSLPPNRSLRTARSDASCVCPGDWVCFPQYKEKP
jgi:hypothetical protein